MFSNKSAVKKFKNLIELVNSIEEANEMRTVQIVVEFIKFGEIETMYEKYTAEVNIEAKWTEKEIIHNYDPDVHWNPSLFIENLLFEHHHYIDYTSEIKDDETMITQHWNIKGCFWEKLELYMFPVDVQELSIIIASRRGKNELKLVSDFNKLSRISLTAIRTFIDQQKWYLFKLVKVSQTASYDEGSTNSLIQFDNLKSQKMLAHSIGPKFSATCYCHRQPDYYFFNAYLLMFLITGSSLSLFSIDRLLPQSRLQTAFTILLTSVQFKWVINRSLPTVSYSTSLDIYSVVCILFLCLETFWHAIIGSFWLVIVEDAGVLKRKDDIELFGRILDSYLFFSFCGLFLIINLAFLIWLCVAYFIIRKLKLNEKKFLDALRKQMSVSKENDNEQKKY